MAGPDLGDFVLGVCGGGLARRCVVDEGRSLVRGYVPSWPGKPGHASVYQSNEAPPVHQSDESPLPQKQSNNNNINNDNNNNNNHTNN